LAIGFARCPVHNQRIIGLVQLCSLKRLRFTTSVLSMRVASRYYSTWVDFIFSRWHAGSIFVDCGSNTGYVDKVTNISWVPDAPYITSGVNGYVPSAQTNYPSFSEFTTVRYFPDSRPKNCYTFPVSPKQTYIIKGTFFYGSYDNATTLPSFKMGIDGNIVANVIFQDANTFVYYEFSYLSQPTNNVTFLCLLRDSSNSVPFISAISLSQLPTYYYEEVDYYPNNFSETKYRLNFGGNGIIRYVS